MAENFALFSHASWNLFRRLTLECRNSKLLASTRCCTWDVCWSWFQVLQNCMRSSRASFVDNQFAATCYFSISPDRFWSERIYGTVHFSWKLAALSEWGCGHFRHKLVIAELDPDLCRIGFSLLHRVDTGPCLGFAYEVRKIGMLREELTCG